MKKIIFCLAILFSLISNGKISHAILIDITNTKEERVIYDDVANRYWFWDINAFADQTYDHQISFINNELNSSHFFGIDSWHIAEFDEMMLLYNNTIEDLNKFNPTLIDGENIWIQGRYFSPSDPSPFQTGIFFIYNAPDSIINGITYDNYLKEFIHPSEYIGPDYKDKSLGAWVVSSNYTPVPEPSSFFLLAVSLASSLGFLLLKKNRTISQQS